MEDRVQPCDQPRATTSILLVDDHGANLDALEAVLAPLGHRIVRASSGADALERLSREEFGLALVDVHMPAMDGFATASLIKARPRSRKLPIIFMTAGDVDADQMARAYVQGAVDFITQPCDPRILRSKAAVFIEWHLQSEEHKRQMAAARRRDRQRYEEHTATRVRNLTDLMPLGVWAANREGRITYTNQAWVDYTGLDARAANDRGHLDVIHPDDRERVVAAWSDAVRAGEPLVVEYRLRRACDGAYRWHLVRAVPERGLRGALVGWIATATDIHDQKDAETRMSDLAARAEAARADAEEASRMKDEFLATVSHELRTPLNAIYGWTRMVRSGELDRRQAEKAMQTIERNTRAQIKLVEDLLDVSRIVAGKLTLELRTVAPGDVVRTAVEAMTPTAKQKGIELVAIYDPTPCRVAADPNRLQQVVWNLVANAIKFTPAGGRVEVIVGSVDHSVEIEVVDSGLGIAPEFLPHVFDAFRQADGSPTRAHGGLGLGLAIVKHIVELHHGAVDVRSEGSGRGARFTVRLPLIAAEQGDRVADWPSRSSGAFARVRELRDVRVLVVDDDEDSRDMLTMVFEQYGAAVERAASAAEALAAIERNRPHILLSDVGMPGEDGHSLIRRVREREGQGGLKLPAIALTGYASAEDGARALAAGFQLHIAKPVDPAELLVLVSRLLDGESGRERDQTAAG
ncbi:MAG TPA: response regulator [Polyangia bacterium]